ncbi:MAG: hypothetical protein QOE08_1293 [Thermoleophilaceae bacterium]|nr:hypothetical protein [Thermoleophilaceae bacterium]
MFTSTAVLAASSPPAGGAAISQVIIATAGAVVVTVLMIALVSGHRSGRIGILNRLGAGAEREMGTAGWAVVPGEILGAALLIAVFGMYWDISLHIDNGRDPGPLANPAHYFILFGLFGVFFAGVIALAMPTKRETQTSIRLPNGWWAPLGALLIVACASVSLIAFPLDDIWHRIFGQDVTLWGPTHLLLIGGAVFAGLAQSILRVEGDRRMSETPAKPRLARVRDMTLAGSLLIGLSTFQAEFDFGVPQFRGVFQPMLIMMAASVALVAARVRLGRGGALGAVATFLVIRSLLALIVGPVLGQTTPHFPLYIVEALLVELVALRVGDRRPLALGLWAGLAIGTVGLAAEWAWSHIWMPIPWNSSMLTEAAIVGLVTALAGGALGGFIGRALNPRGREMKAPPRFVAPAAALVLLAVIAYGIPSPSPSPMPSATVHLRDVTPAPNRTVQATVRLHPADAAKGARWLNITAWQDGGSVVDNLVRVSPGVYRSTQPIPVHDSWKATLRLQRGAAVLGLPVYLPNDPAIPAKEVPAQQAFTRPFVKDKKNLQREQKTGVAGTLKVVAYSFVALIAFSLLGALGWGLNRIGGTADGGPTQAAPRKARREAAPRKQPVSA